MVHAQASGIGFYTYKTFGKRPQSIRTTRTSFCGAFIWTTTQYGPPTTRVGWYDLPRHESIGTIFRGVAPEMYEPRKYGHIKMPRYDGTIKRSVPKICESEKSNLHQNVHYDKGTKKKVPKIHELTRLDRSTIMG